uniref:Uncharacterized protein n=1 Tax=virus sp. ctmTa7 TaxID=2828255 RepID=A0A8S5RCK1_9VIRU|nr:MAG TPA: hypothetical protein [virus sp. ctmTa7]
MYKQSISLLFLIFWIASSHLISTYEIIVHSGVEPEPSFLICTFTPMNKPES